MKNLNKLIGDIYLPYKAVIIFRNEIKNDFYVESTDMFNGYHINIHPLSLNEGNKLSALLDSSEDGKQTFLRSSGVLPDNVLHINPNRNGFAIWYTPAMSVNLYFKPELNLNDGVANVPSLVWKASKDALSVWALNGKCRPDCDSLLFHAPFFNIYQSGNVCMGNVELKIGGDISLENFMSLWQSYFFDSKFSHTLFNGGVKTDIVKLWKNQIGTNRKFPLKNLTNCGLNLKSIIK